METENKAGKNYYRLVIPFIKKYKLWILLNMCVSVLSAGVDITAGHFIQRLTDSTLQGTFQGIGFTVVAMIGLIAVGVASKYAIGISSGKFGFYTVRDLRNQISDNIAKMKLADVEAGHSGMVVSKLTSDVNVLQNLFQSAFPNVLYQLCVFIMAFIYLSSLNVSLIIASVGSVPIIIYVVHALSKPLGKYGRELQESMEQVTAIAQDAAGGVQIEKAYCLQEPMQHKFDKAIQQAMLHALKQKRRTSILNPIQDVIEWIPLLTCAIYGGYLSYAGELSTGSLFAFIYLLKYITDPLTNVQKFISEFHSASASIRRIGELLAAPIEHSGLAAPPIVAKAGAAVTFANVFFAYPGDSETNILRDVSFEVPVGRSVAFVGSSGSGKSTIFKLICAFYAQRSGDIRIFDQSVEDWDMDSMRERLSLVTQDTFLFPMTIMENIAFGRYGATCEAIVKAARMANIHDFIVQLPEGYQTLVGERGVNLSGGQKQRLALARAFLKDAPVLLLDEPTSALDLQSEAIVQDHLEQFMRGRTVMIIAHRLSTIQNVDTIMVMHQGRIVEQGNHAQLMAANGFYRQLYAKQTMNPGNVKEVSLQSGKLRT